MINYNIDSIKKTNDKYTISGWVTEDKKQLSQITLAWKKEKKQWNKFHTRNDVISAGIANEGVSTGFDIEVENIGSLKLVFEGEHEKIDVDIEKIYREKFSSDTKVSLKSIGKKINLKNIKKGIKIVSQYGVGGLKEKLTEKKSVSFDELYNDWYLRHKISEDELKAQRETVFEYQPKISILVPTYNTPEKLLHEMIDSVLVQTYSNFELCIADGSQGNEVVEKILKEYHEKDSRVVYTLLEKNGGIAENTNGALAIATGDYIGLLDHDDMLEPNALFEVVKYLQDRKTDVVYTDEDKVTDDLSRHLDPNFKPDFSIDLLRSHNYITHFFVCKKEIIDEIGGFRKEYDGSQDYDIILRCVEKADVIKHIPMILYNWRICIGSVAENPESKMYAYDAGKRAIADHLTRMGIDGTVEHTGLLGMYRVKYTLKGEPLVSIIIPNKDHTEDLDKCITSVIEKSLYKNFEIVIVENNSTLNETFDYYEDIQKKYTFVKVVKWEGIFNFSAINNFGVSHSKGEYILLLNNDTEMINEDALYDMLCICQRKDVGVVGARLYYEDNTVQHAGVVVGFGNYAGHVFLGADKDDFGYTARARLTNNYSAVTAACLMTKRSVFEEVNGLTEEYVVACNDVDYCLKVREKDYLVVYDAFSEWYHYESKSRGYEDTPEKKERFAKEVEKFGKRWNKILDDGDPFYNSNFPTTLPPFTLD